MFYPYCVPDSRISLDLLALPVLVFVSAYPSPLLLQRWKKDLIILSLPPISSRSPLKNLWSPSTVPSSSFLTIPVVCSTRTRISLYQKGEQGENTLRKRDDNIFVFKIKALFFNHDLEVIIWTNY